MNAFCNDPASGSASSCSVGSRPSGVTYNDFKLGNCTWGAAVLWDEATGLYPAWNGNANLWATNASAQDFLVTIAPATNSIVVIPPGVDGADPQDGHVAWVTGIQSSPGAIYLSVREMNGSRGLNQWDSATYLYNSGMRLIVAPPTGPVTS
jgi:surface antigen